MAITTLLDRLFPQDNRSGTISLETTSETIEVILVFDAVVRTTNEAAEIGEYFIGDPHPDNDALSLINISSSIISGKEWRLSLDYTFSFNNPNEDDQTVLPEFSSWTYQKVVPSDKETGEAIVNTADDPPSPGFVTNISSPQIKITVRGSNVPQLSFFEKIGSINVSAVRILGFTIPKYCAMLHLWQPIPSRDSDNNLYFLNEFTIRINYNKDTDGEVIGFKQEWANLGFRQKVEGAGNAVKIRDQTGQDITSPVFLNEDGSIRLSGTEPFYNQNVVNDLEDFGQFRLPTNWSQYR